jgi:hypothetical protein
MNKQIYSRRKIHHNETILWKFQFQSVCLSFVYICQTRKSSCLHWKIMYISNFYLVQTAEIEIWNKKQISFVKIVQRTIYPIIYIRNDQNAFANIKNDHFHSSTHWKINSYNYFADTFSKIIWYELKTKSNKFIDWIDSNKSSKISQIMNCFHMKEMLIDFNVRNKNNTDFVLPWMFALVKISNQLIIILFWWNSFLECTEILNKYWKKVSLKNLNIVYCQCKDDIRLTFKFDKSQCLKKKVSSMWITENLHNKIINIFWEWQSSTYDLSICWNFFHSEIITNWRIKEREFCQNRIVKYSLSYLSHILNTEWFLEVC